jgi:transcriptional regulator with XRE-family HTH domain
MSGQSAAMFGKHLRAVRERQGMSLRSLAHLSKISLGYMHQIETGKASIPTPARIAEFAKWLRIDGDELAAAAGKVPDDVIRLIVERPELCVVIRQLGAMSDRKIAKILEKVTQ